MLFHEERKRKKNEVAIIPQKPEENFTAAESSRLFYTRASFSVPANRTLPVNIQFQQVAVMSVTASTNVFATIGYSSNQVPIESGIKYALNEKDVLAEKFYHGMTLINRNAFAVTVVLAFAFGNVVDERKNFTFSENVPSKLQTAQIVVDDTEQTISNGGTPVFIDAGIADLFIGASGVDVTSGYKIRANSFISFNYNGKINAIRNLGVSETAYIMELT